MMTITGNLSTMPAYYQDAYLSELTTAIREFRKDDRGIWYVFDDTIFYPRGGGQNSDTGFINGCRVSDVRKTSDKVWHLLDKQIVNPVQMRLDWESRYANMQQHTGQHIISSVCAKQFDWQTVSVHLGRTETLIELECGTIDENSLQQVENYSNELVRSAEPVSAIFVKREELQKYNLRREIKVTDEMVRLISIGEADITGCGGTHVKNTAEVGIIKLIDYEKIRNHIRLKALVGNAAYRYFEALHRQVQSAIRSLSCGIEDIADNISSLLEEQKSLKRQLKDIKTRWLNLLSENLQADADRIVILTDRMETADAIQLSAHWVKTKQRPCFLIFPGEKQNQFVFRLPEKDQRDLREVLKKLSEEFSFRGGGDKKLVQGIIGSREPDEAFRRNISDLLQKQGF